MPEEAFLPKRGKLSRVLELVEELIAHRRVVRYLLDQSLEIGIIWLRLGQELIQHQNPLEEVFTQGSQQDIEQSLTLIPEILYLLRGPRCIQTATIRQRVEIVGKLGPGPRLIGFFLDP